MLLSIQMLILLTLYVMNNVVKPELEIFWKNEGLGVHI